MDIGTISVGMGVSLAEFQAGLKQATALATSEAGNMSAQMKRTSREGAESFRLIDEAIGVHVSRPLTRLIGQTQTLGPLLAGAFQFSAMAAIGVVLAEQGKRLFEITGATQAWRDVLGLAGETVEETAKRMETADQQIIKHLHEKIEMQDAYNELVLGLKGGDFERAHLELLKQETAELQKQLVLQTAHIQQTASATGWRSSPWLGLVGVLAGQDLGAMRTLMTAFGQGTSKDLMDSQIEANKLALAMKPLVEALHQINIEIQKGQWKAFREDADEIAKTLSKFDVTARQITPMVPMSVENLLWQIKSLHELGDMLPGMTGSQMPLYGGTSQAMEMWKLQNDQAEAMKKTQDVLTSIQTPIEKYNDQLAILKELQDQGRITTAQFALAQQQLSEQLAQAEDRMEKMLKEGGAAGGFQAFLMQLSGQGTKGSTGQFTFDLLNKGLQGFEDETVKALTGAKTSWRSFFLELDQMALKFMLNKLFASLLNASGAGSFLSGLFSGGGGAVPSAIPGGADAIGFAGGTDYAPGGLAWVGESGPELVNLPGGSSVTPMSRLGGHTVNVNIDAKGAEIGVEEKIARAISMSAPHIILRAIVEASEVQKRSPS